MARLPEGAPPPGLLATIARLQHLKRRGITVNANIDTSLDFKNPYLLEKIMKLFGIDPYCSNSPAALSCNPLAHFEAEPDEGPFYLFVAKRQERRRQRREKQREMKESFAAAAAAAAAATAAAAPLGSSAVSTAAKSHPPNSTSKSPSRPLLSSSNSSKCSSNSSSSSK
ncbi:hypothetical protein, conserved [Eimeria tenella]|uniref:Uncharacterized protein n=1 Tax=Eimeria tenella TaxID=5802 RepID=U6KUC6_EIMTE|nr:hypothetical protein, conserved [Eimeria tenella]CDJ40513.1 hypothetical protein, conserved [Eimeria tenella]|eukprot:XP_013231263.1 hypothetical protein, conserved [Eimeria tenella]